MGWPASVFSVRPRCHAFAVHRGPYHLCTGLMEDLLNVEYLLAKGPVSLYHVSLRPSIGMPPI